jgi:type I restriction enzyme S subunit
VNWSVARLKNVAQIRISNVDKRTLPGEQEVRLCNYVDVYKNEEISPDMALMRATASMDQVRSFHVRAGDTLITKDSETVDDIAVPAYVKGAAKDMVCGYHLAIVRPVRQLYSRYLYWALASPGFRAQMSASATGVTRFGLRQEAMGNGEIPLPPIEEQRRIADFLDTETTRIDALLQAREKQITCLWNLWESILCSAVEDLTEKYGLVPLRRRIEGIEQGWSPQCDDAPAQPDDWGVLKTSAVSSGIFEPTQHKRLPETIEPDLRYQIRNGDLLLTRGSGSPENVGVASVANTSRQKLLLSDLIYRIRLADAQSPDFFALLLQSRPVKGATAALLRGQSGQTIKLRAEDVKSIPVPAVPAAVQATYAAELTSERERIRTLTDALQKSLTLLKERRQAVITAAVTGELKVPTAR